MPPDSPSLNVTLAILAGGESARMGRAKSSLRFGPQPILAYLAQRLAWPGPTMLITAPGRERPPGFESFGSEYVDPVAGAGPLRGVLTALENLRTPVVALTAVDMPLLTRAQFDWLVQSLRPQALGLMASRITPDGIQTEPFPCVLRRESLEIVKAEISAGHASVKHLSRDNRFIVLPAPHDWPDDIWTNINHPAEWEQFLRTHEPNTGADHGTPRSLPANPPRAARAHESL